MSVSRVLVYLGFKVYDRLKCVLGTDLCESGRCYLCVEDVHRARYNITAVNQCVIRNIVLGIMCEYSWERWEVEKTFKLLRMKVGAPSLLGGRERERLTFS